MKLSKREKTLIFIFIIALAVYVAYKFIPMTNIFNLEALKTEYDLKNIEYNTMSQNILFKTKYEENLQALSEEINNLDVISNLQQEQIIVFLNNYFANNNIDTNNLSFTDVTVTPINPVSTLGEEKVKSSLDTIMVDINKIATDAEIAEQGSSTNNTATSTEQAVQQSTLSASLMAVNVSFESKYNDMLKFIDSIQNNLVDISITNINIISPGGEILQGTMTLNFYEVPKPEGFKEANSELIWNDLATSGKANMFSTDATQMIFSSGNNYDFYMSLQPELSDLPSVLIGRTNDVERKTYISQDVNSVENVSFAFKAENSKYYYRYSVAGASYPSNGEWNEFTPNSADNIKIVIYSKPRILKEDSAGANISVLNTTELKVRFDVVDDDKKSPRANFKDARTISVTRK